MIRTQTSQVSQDGAATNVAPQPVAAEWHDEIFRIGTFVIKHANAMLTPQLVRIGTRRYRLFSEPDLGFWDGQSMLMVMHGQVNQFECPEADTSWIIAYR
jgi:hypothetical protein